MTPGASEKCRRIVLVCIALLVLIATSAEVGWATGSSYLNRMAPGLIAMNPTTGVLFLLVAASLVAVVRRVAFAYALVLISSFCSIVVGTVKLIGYLFGKSLPVDQLVFSDALRRTAAFHNNALAPNTAICFVMLAIAILLTIRYARSIRVATTLNLISMALATVALIGYTYASFKLYTVPSFAPMALPTCLSFLAAGLALICLTPNGGVARVFTQDTMGAILTRRMLPLAMLMPVVVSMSRAWLDKVGMVDRATGSAFAVVLSITLIAAIVVSAAGTISRMDDQRRMAELEAKRLSERLQVEADRADEASRAKSEFLANMSHEIRTPLNGVIGMLDLLELSDLDETQTSYTGIIRQSSDNLLSIIDEIIDVSKIEAGKLTLERIAYDPKQIVTSVAQLFSSPARQKGVSVRAIVPWGRPCVIYGDPTRFRQTITNLVSNAVKFTLHGEIRINMTAKAEGALTHLAITVRDSGIGIPPDRLERIFDHFEQADSGTTRRFGGSGLGLTIAKRLIEMMGGRIGVSSELGRGTTFRIALSAATVSAEPVSPALLGRKCVVFEPNRADRVVVHRMLIGLGATVSHAKSAIEAFEGTAPGDLIFLTHRAEGITVTLRGSTQALVIILAPLGNHPPVKLRKVLEPYRIVFSPFDEAEVVAACTGEGASPRARQISQALNGMKILVAEDNEVNQMVAKRLIERMGAEVTAVVNGNDALAAAASSRFDAILMDCHMPGMDGFEATAKIRELAAPFGRVPILALTASAMDEDRERCLAAGMDDRILKPIMAGALQTAILTAISAKALA